jgi:hypothetical protein
LDNHIEIKPVKKIKIKIIRLLYIPKNPVKLCGHPSTTRRKEKEVKKEKKEQQKPVRWLFHC